MARIDFCCILNSQYDVLYGMANELNSLNLILNQIGDELVNQISLANNIDEKIDTKKLVQQSKTLDDVVIASELSDENKSMLQKFSYTLVQGNTTVKGLRYEKQDLTRVLSNLNDV